MGRHETYHEEDLPQLALEIVELFGDLSVKSLTAANKKDPTRYPSAKTWERKGNGSLVNIRFLPDQVNKGNNSNEEKL